ncbi:MAG: cell division protein ZapE [Parvibaculum sp.]
MNDGPLHRYRVLAKGPEIAHDLAQERAVMHLQRLHDALGDWKPGLKTGRLRLLGLGRAVSPPEGVYLWGDVGRGKSMLMDLFFDGAPVSPKRRIHFHEFMAEAHERIFAFRQKEKGQPSKSADPIPAVAAQIAREATLLCFDEFQVHDIADASILGRLFTQLFELGVVVVATSNRAPSALYEGGLNRHRFLPFIQLVENAMEVVPLDSDKDYRLDRVRGMAVYHSPLGAPANAEMDACFAALTDGLPPKAKILAVKGRAVDVPCAVHDVARFSFVDLCAKPLGASDYLKIAETFHTVFVDHIPQLSAANRNEAKRFVTMIDAFYERKVRLVASAAVAPDALYAAGDGHFEFQRTVSRLMEMQSADYLDAHAALY